MKAELVHKWVDKLRSGEYKQGNGALRREDNSFCCLGVLLDSVDKSKWKLSRDTKKYTYNNKCATLDRKTRERLQLPLDVMMKAMDMNDTGNDFHKIANYLEKELLPL